MHFEPTHIGATRFELDSNIRFRQIPLANQFIQWFARGKAKTRLFQTIFGSCQRMSQPASGEKSIYLSVMGIRNETISPTNMQVAGVLQWQLFR